jgi:hypothetical protein
MSFAQATDDQNWVTASTWDRSGGRSDAGKGGRFSVRGRRPFPSKIEVAGLLFYQNSKIMLYALLPQSCHGLPCGNVSGPQMVNIIAATYKRFISMEREGYVF